MRGDLKLHYEGDVLRKGERNWFEFEWDWEGSREMSCSMIDSEKGENKKLMQKWHLDNISDGDRKYLNKFFACTSFDETASIETYIINGNPTDK